MIAKDSRLVMQDGAHVGAEGLHILADEDSVLLGLIPICLKSSSEVLHRVLYGGGRTNRVLLRGWLWWWELGGGLPGFSQRAYRDPKPRLIRSQLILIEGLISLIKHLLWCWYTRFIFLNNDRLDRVVSKPHYPLRAPRLVFIGRK